MVHAKPDVIAEVWNTVRDWPASKRWSLASLLLHSLNPNGDHAPARITPADLIGVWKVPNPPNDDDVKRIIGDERMRKFGS